MVHSQAVFPAVHFLVVFQVARYRAERLVDRFQEECRDLLEAFLVVRSQVRPFQEEVLARKAFQVFQEVRAAKVG